MRHLVLATPRRHIRAAVINAMAPVAHLPLVFGMLHQREVATVLDAFLPPVPCHMLSYGRGVEALVPAILDGHHALSKVGQRLAERGMLSLLKTALTRAARKDDRLRQSLDALFAANLHRLFGAVARKALAVYAIPHPWLHQDTTPLPSRGPIRGWDCWGIRLCSGRSDSIYTPTVSSS